MASRIYSRNIRSYTLAKRNKMKVKTMTTKHLKFFRDNDYVGIDGLDREQFKDEIDAEYYKRLNRMMELDSKSLPDQWEQWLSVKEELPPEFPFTWCEELNEYIPF